MAEGLFDEELTEEVHLRIREVDQLIPKTLYPSTSGITYWQIESENSILNGTYYLLNAFVQHLVLVNVILMFSW